MREGYRFKKFHIYLIPLACALVWWSMLTGFLIFWIAQGRPQYRDWVHRDPVYLSDIASTNLQPLFIACAALQGICFVATFCLDHSLRRDGKDRLQQYISKHQPRLGIAAIVCAVTSQLSILMVAIFESTTYPVLHILMLGVFIMFAFGACACNVASSIIFGAQPKKLNPVHEWTLGSRRWGNMHLVGSVMKIAWLVAAAAFLFTFALYIRRKPSVSSLFEWILCYWYGILLALLSRDMLPSAVVREESLETDCKGA